MAARIWDVLKRHRGLSALLAVHAVLFWAVIAAGSPWATAGVECASGAMAEGMLGSSSWSPWDLFHGALGGMFVAALAGLPLFAVFGVTALGMKILVWLCAVVVVVVAYHLLDRTEGRRAAAIGAAGLVFAPPALFHVSSVYGNWHWTQAVFDYGVTLVALELARRGAAAGLRSWAAMGLVTGFVWLQSPLWPCLGFSLWWRSVLTSTSESWLLVPAVWSWGLLPSSTSSGFTAPSA